MDTFVMNMDGYEVEEYGDEVLDAEWNPQLVLSNHDPAIPANRHVDLHPAVANMDIDGFLRKMYEYQC